MMDRFFQGDPVNLLKAVAGTILLLQFLVLFWLLFS